MLALVAVCSCTVAVGARPVAAAQLTAASTGSVYRQLQVIGAQLSALGQRFDEETARVDALTQKIRNARAQIQVDITTVAGDRLQLRKAAIAAYVDEGSVASTNPLFATNANELGAASVYVQVADGNLSGSVATLTNAQAALASDQHKLRSALSAEEAAVATTASERSRGMALQAQLTAEYKQAEASAAYAEAQDQANAAALDAYPSVTRQSSSSFPDPPPNSKGEIAVDFALSMVGVPYCWGGASRACVDCSGLTMLSWAAAGVQLPHYSGAQMADTTPVPVNDIEPGDLIFYGPGGSEHVAIYYQDGLMIEAPYTGAYVHVTPVRFYGGFAGVGRP